MDEELDVNKGVLGLAGTADGTLAEYSGGLEYFERKQIRKAMRTGVDFLVDGLYPDAVFDGFVFTVRPLNHDACESARKSAMKHFGVALYGEDWDDDGAPDWPPAVTRMIKARWILSSIMSYKGKPIMLKAGEPFDATGLKGAALRTALHKALCPDYEHGLNWDEDEINEAFDKSDHDEDFTLMIEKIHTRWKKSIDARKFLKCLNHEDPTQRRFLASPGNSS